MMHPGSDDYSVCRVTSANTPLQAGMVVSNEPVRPLLRQHRLLAATDLLCLAASKPDPSRGGSACILS